MFLQRINDNCDQTRNAPVQVYNECSNEGPAAFTYTDKLIPRFSLEPTFSGEDKLPCTCQEYYDEKGLLKIEFGRLIRECQNDECYLRSFQRGVQKKMRIYYQKKKKMWGVRSLEVIKKGTFIAEYTGELYKGQFETENDEYIFAYSDQADNMAEFPLNEDGTPQTYTIDAHAFGNVSRFFNHSCSPNMVSHKVRVGREPYLRIGFFANEDIFQGAELTIDYGPDWWEVKISEFSCKCGRSNCKYRK